MKDVIIRNLTEEEILNRGIRAWPVWSKEISEFDWFYDSGEECLILEGEITVHTDNGDYEIKAGDFVTFRKGLSCKWDVKSPVKKHYSFK